jgi:signal transduction histidine kinase
MGHQVPDVEQATVRPPIPHPPRQASAHPARLAPRRAPEGSSLALRNWPVTWRLIALIAIPTLMGLTFGILRVTAANSSAHQFSQVRQLALLGQQVTGLAQALEDERDLTAGFIAAGRPAAEQAKLTKQYAVTDAWADQVRRLSGGIGASYPAPVQARVNVVLARLSDLAGLRGTAEAGDVDALPLIIEYSSSLDNILSFNDEIAQGSANSALADTVRTLSSLSRVKDDASLQRAIVYAALTERQFELGAPEQLTAAQAQQAANLSQFQNSATLAEQQLFNTMVPAPSMDQDQVLETLTVDVANPQDVGVSPDQWYGSMSGTIDHMRAVEQNFASSVVTQSLSLEHGAEGAAVLTGILSVALLIIAGVATFIVARSMVRPLRALRSDALEIASLRLPEKVRELHDAEDPEASLYVAPVSVHSVDEIGQVARAFDRVHREAVRLAGNESVLRSNMNAMFVSLSRRSQSLLERLVRLIDSLEQSEDDPDRLSNLFTMDHLVTRMRRHSENLLVLAGHEPARKWAEPVALTNVVRAAMSEILEYNRVVPNVQPNVAVSGPAVNDIVHLLAEIIENATLFSAGECEVHVSGRALDSGGILIEVTDSGVGIPPERLEQLNSRLDNPPAADVSVSRHMGLFAVAHLALRHGVRVRLRQGSPRGLTALVWIPQTLITTDTTGKAGWGGAHSVKLPKAAVGQGWSAFGAFGRHRSIRKAIEDQEVPDGPEPAAAAGPAVPAPARPTEPMPVYDSVASDWFRRGGQVPVPVPGTRSHSEAGGAGMASWNSPGDAGWRAAESAAVAPVLGQLTAAGLPQRIPRANMVPGSVGGPAAERRPAPAAERRAPAGDDPVPAGSRRSPDVARARLAGFQRGTRRAESTAGSRGGRSADG